MPTPAEQLARAQGLTGPLHLANGITQGELATILHEAAVESEKLLQANLRAAGNAVSRAQYQAATQGLGSLSASLWGKVGAATRAGVHGAADLAVNSQLDREYLIGMPFSAIVQYQETYFFNAFQAAEDILSRRTNGFTLAQRIYRNGIAGTLQAGKIVERGLAQQLSAREIAKQVRGLYEPGVRGGQSYAAMRLARTEINNAHHDTTIRLTKDAPWVQGYKWHLSSSHPKPDICNVYAERDHSGMGAGVYSKTAVPSKPHPHCLCYVEVVQPPREQFLRNLVNGGYDDHLSSGLGVRC